MADEFVFFFFLIYRQALSKTQRMTAARSSRIPTQHPSILVTFLVTVPKHLTGTGQLTGSRPYLGSHFQEGSVLQGREGMETAALFMVAGAAHCEMD